MFPPDSAVLHRQRSPLSNRQAANLANWCGQAGHHTGREIAIARELIEIRRDAEGWRVSDRHTDFKRVHFMKFQAIHRASTPGIARYKDTWRSIGASVAAPSGKAVMVALCGQSRTRSTNSELVS